MTLTQKLFLAATTVALLSSIVSGIYYDNQKTQINKEVSAFCRQQVASEKKDALEDLAKQCLAGANIPEQVTAAYDKLESIDESIVTIPEYLLEQRDHADCYRLFSWSMTVVLVYVAGIFKGLYKIKK